MAEEKKAAGAEKKETLILSAEEFVERILRPNLTTGRRFCFILGSGASMKSGIPAGNTLELIWMDWLMGVADDVYAPGGPAPKLSPEEAEDFAKKLEAAGKITHSFDVIRQEWEQAKQAKRSMSSEYYFDIYNLRFFPDLKTGERYMENLMEKAYPSIGYHTLALLLSKNSRHNLVITTNFDSMVEDALFIYTNTRPRVAHHEALADYMQIDADGNRPIVAKVHRGVMYAPFNSPDTTSKLPQEWEDALTFAFQIYTPIVIGYGGGDRSLMSFLEKDDTPIRHGLYWCYLGKDGEPPEEERIRQLVEKVKDGCFVAIKGFDDLMLKIGEALYQEEVLPGNTEAFLDQQTKARLSLYNEQYQELRSDNPEVFQRMDAAQQAEEEKSATEGELTVWDYFRRGNRAADEGDFPKAIEAYSKAIELDPDYAAAYYNRGSAYDDLKQYDEAIADYSKAIELDPDDAAVYNNRGSAYDDLKQYDEAIADYSKAIELKPDYAAAYNNRGFAYRKQGKYNEAIADFSKAIELDPNNIIGYLVRGLAYYEDRKYEEAIEDYNKAIELDPNYANAYYNRGTAYEEDGKHDKAIADFSEAIKLKPDLAAAYNNRGLAYAGDGKHDKAIADFSEAIKLKPDLAAAYYNRGNAYYELEQWGRSIADYNKAIELDLDYAEAYHNRGFTYYKLKQWDKAIADFSKLIELDPNDAWLYANRGEAYCKLEDHGAAIRDCSKAIELAPDFALAHTYRAKAYRAIGQIDLAEADEKRARILRNQKRRNNPPQ
ncbi:MAG: tetratricopeptide repeat protein [Bacillota bacterium]|nr:tetratricopeptide repeat protein [Bacillota bacterium]